MKYRQFSNKSPDFKKLREYGFEEGENSLKYGTEILNGQFTLQIKIPLNGGEEEVRVFDGETGEEYTLHLVASASGEFVGQVRSEIDEKLNEIAKSCYFVDVFKSAGAKELISYARAAHGDGLEFLWSDLPDAAILRRKNTKKWYAAFMKISAKKLGLDGENIVEVAAVRAPKEEVESLIDGERIFRAYHMNKKSWITLLLSFDGFCEFLERSYSLAK